LLPVLPQWVAKGSGCSTVRFYSGPRHRKGLHKDGRFPHLHAQGRVPVGLGDVASTLQASIGQNFFPSLPERAEERLPQLQLPAAARHVARASLLSARDNRLRL
jgi:hypothetical protein